MAYGNVGYRRRYGSRYNYYARAGYEGIEAFSGAPAANAVPMGYGESLPVRNAPPAAVYGYGDPWGLFGIGKKKKRKREPTKFWNTVLDVGLVGAAFLNPGAIITVPIALGIVGARKVAMSKRKAAEAEVQTERKKKKTWKARAESAVAVMEAAGVAQTQNTVGQGNVGTASGGGEMPAYDVGTSSLASPVVLIGGAVGLLVLGGLALLLLRPKGR